jgi:hypothetical protein
MQDDADNIPVLTNLIEPGVEIELSELGLDDDPSIDLGRVSELVHGSTELEQEIDRILDKHIERARQEIRIALKQARATTQPDENSQSD